MFLHLRYDPVSTSSRTLWRHHVLLQFMTYILTLWRTFRYHDILLTSPHTFWRYFWCDVLLDLTTYFLTSCNFVCRAVFLTPSWHTLWFLTLWRIFWRHDLIFDVMTYIYKVIYDRSVYCKTFYPMLSSNLISVECILKVIFKGQIWTFVIFGLISQKRCMLYD